MFFGRFVAQSLAFAAIAGVFGEIPIVSEWAFWFMVGAYLLWLAVTQSHTTRVKWVLMLTLLLTMAAIVGVFVYIPVISQWAFWVVISAYLLLASHRQYVIWVAVIR